MSRKVVYSEKLVEDFIRDHPEVFLGEPLTLVAQQPKLAGFRPDLLFQDSTGRLVIVEVQINALDRAHLYKSLEYRDLLKLEQGVDDARVLLFCNELPERFRSILRTYTVEIVVLSQSDLVSRFRELDPSIELLSPSRTDPEGKLTVSKLLKALGKREGDRREERADAVCFWLPPEHSGNTNYDYEYRNLADPTENPPEIDDIDTRPVWPIPVPVQINVDRTSLCSIDQDRSWMFQHWLELLLKYWESSVFDKQIVLGRRRQYDRYRYEWHIKDRIRLFEPIWRHYQQFDEGSYSIKHDRSRLSSDLDHFFGIKLFVGRYPDLRPESIFASYELIEGPGPLQASWDDVKRFWRESKRRNEDVEREIEEEEADLKTDDWLTISFKSIRRQYAESFLRLLRIANVQELKFRNGHLTSSGRSWGLLAPPAELRGLDEESLLLAGKYFAHLEPIVTSIGRSTD